MIRASSTFSFGLGSYFAPQVYSCGILGIAVGVYLFYHGLILHPLLVLLFSLLIISTRKGAAINPQKKWMKKYVRMGSLPFGREVPYKELEEFILVKRRVSQAMHSRVSSSTIRYDLYQVFAIADRQKFLLLESKRKEKALAKLQALSKAAAVPVKDFS